MKHPVRETAQQLIQDADIIEIISEFVTLTKAGKEYKGLCPFHTEKTPSFTVNPAKKVFYCFGCGAGGDVLSFLRRYEDWSFMESLEFLAKRQGLSLPKYESSFSDNKKNREKEIIIQINESAARYFHNLLLESIVGRDALKYLDSRKLSPETIKEFCLGYSKNSWKDLLLFLERKNISPLKAVDAGLASFRQGGAGSGCYDRFRGRLIFPIYNEYGQITAMGGRKIKESSTEPKYLNSSETRAYSKSKCLYGLYQAKQFIRSCGYALVVEGYIDFLSLFQNGLKNTVATLGTALTFDHVKLLGRYTKKVVFIYDADPAGISAMLRGLNMFQEQNIEVQILLLPSGFDPDTFIYQYGPEVLKERIEKSISAIEFLINQSIQRNNISTIEGKAKAVKEILQILSQISDPLIRMEYIKMVANLLDVREEILLDELRPKIQREGKGSQGFYDKDTDQSNAEQMAEQMLLRLLCHGDISMEELAAESIAPEDFQSELIHEIAKIVFLMWREEGKLKREELLFAIKDEKLKEMVSNFFCMEIISEDIEREFQDCVAKLNSRKLGNKLNLLQNQIKSRQHDDPELNLLLKEYSEIKKKNLV